ncbi:DJ-1/PfpI family protein [Streptomyces sp. NPDC059092]|uniref:DJ-1/PfpI family protein n=1 Tax=Streptomyces sp. NPDC059092 TaxID=3346725 RepID=UPI0036C87229
MLAQIVLFDGFDPLDVVAPYEVLFAGGALAEGALTVELVSAEGAREVPSGTGTLTLKATTRLDPARADLVVVPGAAGRFTDTVDAGDRAEAGADAGAGGGGGADIGGGPDTGAGADAGAGGCQDLSIFDHLQGAVETELAPLLREAHARPGLTMATVCGGSLLMGMAGLLVGRHATTHSLGCDGLTRAGAIAVNARVVDDGDLVSGGGVTSGLDLALYLLEREVGSGVAHVVEQLFEYERRGTVWRAPTARDASTVPASADRI